MNQIDFKYSIAGTLLATIIINKNEIKNKFAIIDLAINTLIMKIIVMNNFKKGLMS